MILNRRLPLAYILKSTYIDFLIVVAFTGFIATVQFYIEFVTFPVEIAAFLGTAISLVISFHLSLSYDRWWEARKIWGEIVNDSRALVLQLQSFTDEQDKAVLERITRLQIAWNYALVALLRKQTINNAALRHLPEQQQHDLLKAVHQPLYLSTKIKDAMKALQSLNDYQRVQIDTTLVRLVGHMGKAERIKNTPFPKEYSLVLHLSIYLFLGFMSISLANLGQHWETALLVVISAPLFLLATTARHLQDPFENLPTDVPIASISRNIEINLLTLLEVEDIPAPAEDKGYYIN